MTAGPVCVAGMVAVFCGVAGVQPQSETVWRQAVKYNVPRIAFVNKMDRVGADFERVVGMMRENLHANAVAAQLPIGSESEFKGVIDLVHEKEYWFLDEQKGAQYEERPISAENLEKPV